MSRSSFPAIGELIALYRKEHKLTVRGMAPKIGVSPATLSRIERGKPMDSLTMLRVMRWLFGGDR